MDVSSFDHYVMNYHEIGRNKYRFSKWLVDNYLRGGLGYYGDHVPKTKHAMCDFILDEDVMLLADVAKKFYDLGYENARDEMY